MIKRFFKNLDPAKATPMSHYFLQVHGVPRVLRSRVEEIIYELLPPPVRTPEVLSWAEANLEEITASCFNTWRPSERGRGYHDLETWLDVDPEPVLHAVYALGVTYDCALTAAATASIEVSS